MLSKKKPAAGVHCAQGEAITLGQFLRHRKALEKLRDEYKSKCDAGQRRVKVEVSCAAAVAAQLLRAAAFPCRGSSTRTSPLS